MGLYTLKTFPNNILKKINFPQQGLAFFYYHYLVLWLDNNSGLLEIYLEM